MKAGVLVRPKSIFHRCPLATANDSFRRRSESRWRRTRRQNGSAPGGAGTSAGNDGHRGQHRHPEKVQSHGRAEDRTGGFPFQKFSPPSMSNERLTCDGGPVLDCPKNRELSLSPAAYSSSPALLDWGLRAVSKSNTLSKSSRESSGVPSRSPAAIRL